MNINILGINKTEMQGEKGTWYKIGIKTDADIEAMGRRDKEGNLWINGASFNNKAFESWEAGMEVELDFEEKNGYWNFYSKGEAVAKPSNDLMQNIYDDLQLIKQNLGISHPLQDTKQEIQNRIDNQEPVEVDDLPF